MKEELSSMPALPVEACIWMGGELEKVQEICENDYSEELAKRPPFIDRAYEMARQKNAPNKICPKCLKEMHRREWLGSQILIDVCSDCFGVWLDKGELQDLEQYFERLNADLSPEMERMLEGMESGKKRGFWASFKSLFEGD